jgi:hypothetical protein
LTLGFDRRQELRAALSPESFWARGVATLVHNSPVAVAVAFAFIAADLRRSLENFSNDTGATTVCIGGATQ